MDIFEKARQAKLDALPRKVTKDEVLELSRDEAMHLIKRVRGNVSFMLKCSAFMPTGEDRGFEGIHFIFVDRKTMLKAVDSMLSEVFEQRGARLRVYLTAADPDRLSDRAYISIH